MSYRITISPADALSPEEVIGEIQNPTNLKISLPHLRVPTCEFEMQADNEYAQTLLTRSCLVRVDRSDPLHRELPDKTIFHGQIISTEDRGDANSQTIAVSAVGPLWRLTKRYLPRSLTKAGHGGGTLPDEVVTTMQRILTEVNEADTLEIGRGNDDWMVGYTGIDLGNLTDTGTTVVYGPVWLKTVADALAELSSGISSFEYRLRPVDKIAHGADYPFDILPWRTIAEMDMAPVIGVNRPDAIFEYGTTSANVESYTRKQSIETQVTRAIMSVSGWPDSPAVTTVDGINPHPEDIIIKDSGALIYNDNSYNYTHNGYGVVEDVIPDLNIIDETLRTRLVEEHLRVRKLPRQIITFTPAQGQLPSPISDYETGDTVRLIVVTDSINFDVSLRVWGLTLSLDGNGRESVELELVNAG